MLFNMRPITEAKGNHWVKMIILSQGAVVLQSISRFSIALILALAWNCTLPESQSSSQLYLKVLGTWSKKSNPFFLGSFLGTARLSCDLRAVFFAVICFLDFLDFLGLGNLIAENVKASSHSWHIGSLYMLVELNFWKTWNLQWLLLRRWRLQKP